MKIIRIDDQLLTKTSKLASTAERGRMNHNFHQNDDTIQRFLNAIRSDSYIRPHQHINPLKEEIFLILKGKGATFLFDENGQITDMAILDPNQGQFGVEIPPGLYHTIISLSDESVFYEIKQGPYIPTADKGFAPWAPEEGTPESLAYLKELQDKVADQFN